METNAVYVFIIAVPAEAPKEEKYFELWKETRDIIKNLDYVSDWIEGELYFLHYHYFYSFNQVIVKLGKLAENNDKVKILPSTKLTEAKLLVEIGYRIGYVYDTRSSFSQMLNIKIENPEAI
jgi:hypothetical protein